MIEATNNLGESSSNIPELAKKQNLNKDNNREISFYLSLAYILIDLVKENGTKSNYLEKLKSQKKIFLQVMKFQI